MKNEERKICTNVKQKCKTLYFLLYTLYFFCYLCILMERILITGATGFIGSFIVEEALRQGMEVWATVRSASRLDYLQDSRINKVLLDLSSVSQMSEALAPLHLDYVVHAAGATKALHRDTFYQVNTEGTKNLVQALLATNPTLKRFVFISSLSVMGAVREQQPYEAITENDVPQPNTSYGMSKLAAEQWLRKHCTLPFTILRPTGVYGPREKDYMTMVHSIRRGIDIAAGFTPQVLTFVYVTDVVQAVFLSMKSAKSIGRAYFLTDGEVYTSRTFSDYIIQALGKKHVLRFTLPLSLLRIVCAVSDMVMHLTGKLSTLNNDHYNILAQRNWLCDITPAMTELGYQPQVKLREGVGRMVHSLVHSS